MSTSNRNRIGLRMHGARVNLSCDYEPQLRYTADLLGTQACEPWERADLEIASTWHTGGSKDEPAFDVSGLDAYGKRMHLGDDELVWSNTLRDTDLQLRFRRLGSVLHCDVHYHYRPSPKKLEKYGDYEQKKFFDLMRYLVYFPVAWHLRRTRGWEMIHASGVASRSGAVLIAGPGGAGKSTTCLALVARAGMTLLAENLMFTDGENVYPVSEPIRLTPESLELLGDSAAHLESIDQTRGVKSMFVAPADIGEEGVRPALLFLARFSREGFARPIPPPMAREMIRATNVLTLELNDFYWYAAALDLLWPPTGAPRQGPIERLTMTTPCYLLGIDRAGGVEPVVERIRSYLNEKPEPALETQLP